MRILVISSGNVVQLNSYSRHFVRKGHEVVFTNPSFQNAVSDRGIKEEFKDTGVEFFTYADFVANQVWERVKFDCIFITQHGAIFEGWKYKNLLRIPTLLQVLDIPTSVFDDPVEGIRLRQKFQPIIPLIGKFEHVTVINSEIKKQVKDLFEDKSCMVTWYPIDTELFDSTPDQKTEEFVLCVSRLCYFKRVDLAIRAAHHAKKKLILVGDGTYRKELELLAKDLKADVTFLGCVMDKEKAELVKKCKLHAFTQLAANMACIPPAEAIYCKKPSITFAYPDQMEIDGSFSSYIPRGDWESMGNKINWIWANYKTAKRKVEEGSKWAYNNLRQEIVAQQILDILESIVEEGIKK